MKSNYRRLGRLLKVFSAESFYTASVWESSVTAQGRFKPETVVVAKKLRFTVSIADNGYIKLTRGNYEITLTN